MKAVQLPRTGGPDVLIHTDVPDPVPGPGQVLVEVHAAGVNFADTMIRAGAYPVPLDLPVVLGEEIAGVVTRAPAGHEHLVGTRVTAFTPDAMTGGYAQRAAVDLTDLFAVPDTLDWHDAVALPAHGMTALGALRDAARLHPGETVLVQAGAGGVGSMAVQIARALGAGTIVAAAGGPDKAALTRTLGADLAVDYLDPGWTDEVRTAVGSVDVALDALGGTASRDLLQLVTPATGRIVPYGNLSGAPPSLTAMDLVYPSIALVGFALPTHRARPGWSEATMGQLLAWTSDGTLKPLRGPAHPLEGAAAHHQLGDRATTGKIVLTTR